MEFSSLSELYNKLLPVLKTKVNEMKLRGINFISIEDIWNFQKNKWQKSTNLTFSDMVSDILNTNDSKYIKYIENKWKEKEKTLNN